MCYRKAIKLTLKKCLLAPLHMTEPPNSEEIKKWNRWFAVECNNAAWELIEKVKRTDDENTAMLNAAYSASFHWSAIGTNVNRARATDC